MHIIPNLSNFFSMFNDWLGYIYTLDAVFAFFIMLIALMIGFYSYKIHNFTGKRKYLLFSIAFLFISLGYGVKAGFDILVQEEGLHKLIFFGMLGFPLASRLALLAYMLFVLMGYIILIVIAMKGNRKTALMLLLLLVTSLIISQSYFLTFNLNIIILAGFLVYHFYRNFDSKRTINSGIVWFSFFIIMLSYVINLLIVFSNKFYLLANIFQMAGFLLLLLNYMLVQRK